MKLAAIDGTGKDGKAPCPQRGLMKAMYKTVEAIGGYATRKQIKDLLPAAIDNINQVVNDKKITASLGACVYRGHMIHRSTDDTYAIAPMSYYTSRQAYLSEPKPTVRAKKLDHDFNVEVVREHNWWVTGALSAAFFFAGLSLGMML